MPTVLHILAGFMLYLARGGNPYVLWITVMFVGVGGCLGGVSMCVGGVEGVCGEWYVVCVCFRQGLIM